jgi:hypothetical protein
VGLSVVVIFLFHLQSLDLSTQILQNLRKRGNHCNIGYNTKIMVLPLIIIKKKINEEYKDLFHEDNLSFFICFGVGLIF